LAEWKYTLCEEENMKKEKEKTENEQKKVKYVKPVLTKHKKLRDMTGTESIPG
jgi:hypothetical protein